MEWPQPSSSGVTRLRRKRYPFKYGTLMCTFHPAAALRGGAAANGIAEDFEEIKRVLDEHVEPAEDPGEQLDLFG